MNNGQIEAAYFNADTAGTEDSDGGQPLQTGEFGDEDNFEGWDFDSVWKIDTGQEDDDQPRPLLRRLSNR